jgi:hypothetical protein
MNHLSADAILFALTGYQAKKTKIVSVSAELQAQRFGLSCHYFATAKHARQPRLVPDLVVKEEKRYVCFG